MVYTLIVNGLLAFKLIWDYQAKNKEHRVINHGRSALIDVAIYIISGYLIYKDFRIVGAILLISLGYRWIMFDIIFNLLNKDKWNHYGESSLLDKILKKTGKFHLVIKALPIILGLILIYIL